MSISSTQKYRQLIKEVSNWPQYFVCKYFGKGKVSDFVLRKSGATITIPFGLLRVFKEVFMQDGYRYSFVQAHLKPGTTVLDIGANIGMFSAWIANHFPGRPIIAFEPLEGNLTFLKKNLENGQVFSAPIDIVEKVVTGQPKETVTFYFDKTKPESDSASVIEGFYNNNDGVVIPAVSLTDIVAKSNNRIGLLKMDCEGSEYDILYNTSANVFEKVDTMIIETHDIDKEKNNLKGVCDFLTTIGFSFTTERVDDGLNLVWAKNNQIFPA